MKRNSKVNIYVAYIVCFFLVSTTMGFESHKYDFPESWLFMIFYLIPSIMSAACHVNLRSKNNVIFLRKFITGMFGLLFLHSGAVFISYISERNYIGSAALPWLVVCLLTYGYTIYNLIVALCSKECIANVHAKA